MSVLFSGQGSPVEGHFIGPAVHDYYLIHVVIDGEGSVETLGETYACSAGDVFVIFPDVLVKYEADKSKPWSYMWVSFSGGQATDMLKAFDIIPERPVIRGCSLLTLQRMLRSLRKSLDRPDFPALGNMESSGWLRLVLGELAQSSQLQRREREADKNAGAARMRSNHQIEQAIRLLTFQYGQQLSIEAIARTLGYHRAHLTKIFKDATGMSPKQYLFKVRMEKAEELLEGELTIAQIAASVGYNDALFFTKQFHKWSGQSPTTFRRERQKQQD